MRKKRSDTRFERNAQIAREFLSGKPLGFIAEQFGITCQRVHQIVKAHDCSGRVGQALRAKQRTQDAQLRQDKRSLIKWGCDYATYRRILKNVGKPTYKFQRQRENAKKRGIDWRLTLVQWWSIWEASGKWYKRGLGTGYVMSRVGDTGPYEVGNVFIQTARANNSFRPQKRSGLPTGVALRPNGLFQAKIQVAGCPQVLGCYTTAEAAGEAYQTKLKELDDPRP